MSETIYYDQEWFNRDIKTITAKIKESKQQFDVVVGVLRGGVIPATCLSHALNLPLTTVHYDPAWLLNTSAEFKNLHWKGWTNILLVDDLTDSGKCLNDILWASSQLANKITISVATLLHNTVVDLGVEHYFGTQYNRQNEKRHFDFWWEVANKGVIE